MEKKHWWFHKPNDENPEIPDITISRDLYAIKLDQLRLFIDYNGDKLDLDKRYDKYRLVRFNAPIFNFIVIGVNNRRHLNSFDFMYLHEKLIKHNVGFLEIRETVIGSEGYAGATLKSIKYAKIKFEHCFISTDVLRLLLNINISRIIYDLKFVTFKECYIPSYNLHEIAECLKTNYKICRLILEDIDEDKFRYRHDPNVLMPDSEVEINSSLNRDILKLEISSYVERNNRGYDRCKKAILLILMIKRFSRNSLFDIIGIDIVRLIAKILWNSRGTKIWCDEVKCELLDNGIDVENPPPLENVNGPVSIIVNLALNLIVTVLRR